jgi:hypothetical protein
MATNQAHDSIQAHFSNPPKTKSLRRKSGKKPGGQKGYPGDTLRPTAEAQRPDATIHLRQGDRW